jgi:glycolate oxidase FAD binding subunit
MDTVLAEWIERVKAATAARRALCIRGGGTKDFYGNAPRGEHFDTREWSGVESYEPSELVITVRAGTLLADVEALLVQQRQMLAFEPPHFAAGGTIGGCVAAGLAGPRRTSAGYTYGGVRDAVLGARLLDGHGRLLRFGGTVMKNVAGYDVSRVLAGSLGMLGVIVDVSLKVLPMPAQELTLQFECSEAQALEQLNVWGGRPLPISASCWRDGQMRVRLSGSSAALTHAARELGGERLADAPAADFWRALRDQQDGWFRSDAFKDDAPLWRLALPSVAKPLALAGEQCIEWGGAQRWLNSSLPAANIRERAQQLGGHATLFRGGDHSAGVFTPLAPGVAAIHRRLKQAFDPAAIFNPGRMYAEF